MRTPHPSSPDAAETISGSGLGVSRGKSICQVTRSMYGIWNELSPTHCELVVEP
jgi:hypothetical protein